MEEERQAKAKKEAKLASKTAITPTVAAAPTTPTETPPKEKPEVMAVGKDKLDPKNPLDAKILEAINKQLEKEKAADSQKESTPQVESSKTIPSPTISPVAPIETASAVTPTMDKVEAESTSEIATSISKLQSSFDNLAASLTTFPTNIKSLEKTLQETFGKLDKSSLKKNKTTATVQDDKGRVISNKTMAVVNMIDKPISAGGVEPTDITAKETDKQQDRELLAQAIADKLSEVLGNSGGTGLPDIGDVIPDGNKKTKGGKVPGKMAGRLATLGKFGGPLAAALTVGTSAYEGYSDYQTANEQLAAGTITQEEAKTAKGGAVGKGAGGAVGGLAGAATGALAGAAIGSVVPVVGTAIGGLIGGALGAWGGSEVGKAGGEYIGRGVSQTGTSEPILDPESAAMSASMEPSTSPKVQPAIKQRPGLGSSPMKVTPNTSVNINAQETKGQKLSQITSDNSELKSSAQSAQIIQPIISSSVTTTNNKDNFIPVAPRPRNDMSSIERYLDKVR